jgi:hypothetical protein
MLNLERLLSPDADELPDCVCGSEMILRAVADGPSRETQLRTYACESCGRELRVLAWSKNTEEPGTIEKPRPISGC